MKKYFSVFSLMLMAMCCNVVFTSCGDDDDDDDDVVVEKHFSAKDLIGTWEYSYNDPRDISTITFFEDGTALNIISNPLVNPRQTKTLKLIEAYEVVGDSIFFVHKYLYNSRYEDSMWDPMVSGLLVSDGEINRYKDSMWDSMWRPLDNESRKGAKFEFVDENTLKIIDSGNKDKPEIILHRTSAKVEKIEIFDKRIVGTWERIVDGDCRDIVIFDAEGNYHHMDQDLRKDSFVKYYDENLTYYQDKGYCNAINGTMNFVLTLEWDHKWNEMEWREINVKGTVSYEVVDENTFKLIGTEKDKDTGKVATFTYTRVK